MYTPEKLKEALEKFKLVVHKPAEEMLGAEILPIEDIKQLEQMDRKACVDGWMFKSNCTLPLNFRVLNDTGYPYSFTVRCQIHENPNAQAEYQKICHAIDNDCTYPKLFLIAYIQKHPVLALRNIGITKTENVIDIIRNGELNKDYRIGTNPEDGNNFYAVDWDKVIKKGGEVLIWDKIKYEQRVKDRDNGTSYVTKKRRYIK